MALIKAKILRVHLINLPKLYKFLLSEKIVKGNVFSMIYFFVTKGLRILSKSHIIFVLSVNKGVYIGSIEADIKGSSAYISNFL
jgi:hypothetical protein